MVAVAGIGIIICTKRLSKSTMQLIFDFFIALGVSTMLASALLHFLPEVLGISTGQDYIAAVGKLSVVLAVFYIFWLFEQMTHMLGPGIQIRIANSLYCEKLRSETDSLRRKTLGVRFAFAIDFWPKFGPLLGHEHSHGEFEEDHEAQAQGCGSDTSSSQTH